MNPSRQILELDRPIEAQAQKYWEKRDKVRNEDIRTKIGVASIKKKMRENRLRWFGHVWRKPTDVPVRRAERITLGQVKKAQGDQRKHGWRWYDKI